MLNQVFAESSSIDSWEPSTAGLEFRFGRWTLGTWEFPCLANSSVPVLTQSDPARRPMGSCAVVYRQLRDDGAMPRTLLLSADTIRYIPYRSRFFYIDLAKGSLESYLTQFSKKTRGYRRREIRKFAKRCGGELDLRCYRSTAEIACFREHAIGISKRTYQEGLGFGFPNGEEFRLEMTRGAKAGLLRGYLLMCKDRPITYALCRVERDVLIHSFIGYDPDFGDLSPGKVLLLLMLERLFAEKEFRFFTLGASVREGADDYKSVYSTDAVKFLRVFWFPTSPKNIALVLSHYLLRTAWRAAARVKGRLGNPDSVARGPQARML